VLRQILGSACAWIVSFSDTPASPVRRLLRAICCTVTLSAAAFSGASSAAAVPPGEGTLLVGATSRSVLPLVNGSLDYMKAALRGREDATDPGILGPKWDDGRIAVGNGESDSYWVRDDVRATALAIEYPRSPDIVVVVASDLYMVFRHDGDVIRDKAAALLPPGIAMKLKVLISATHNHHGPDTAFDVNHDWYEHMSGQMAQVISDAVRNRRPARLHFAAGQHAAQVDDGGDRSQELVGRVVQQRGDAAAAATVGCATPAAVTTGCPASAQPRMPCSSDIGLTNPSLSRASAASADRPPLRQYSTTGRSRCESASAV
jgi:hypothetical protein